MTKLHEIGVSLQTFIWCPQVNSKFKEHGKIIPTSKNLMSWNLRPKPKFIHHSLNNNFNDKFWRSYPNIVDLNT